MVIFIIENNVGAGGLCVQGGIRMMLGIFYVKGNIGYGVLVVVGFDIIVFNGGMVMDNGFYGMVFG